MPEYLAPGVYIEEVSFRSKSIEGVSTTTTGFIGASRYGPIDQVPDILTGVGEFEYVYGDHEQLQFYRVEKQDAVPPTEPAIVATALAPLHNYLWHAARAFFTEGGKRLYVTRVFKPLAGDYPPTPEELASAPSTNVGSQTLYYDGYARAFLTPTPPENTDDRSQAIQLRARFPGAAGNMRLRLTVRIGQNILGTEPVPGQPNLTRTTVRSLTDRDIVLVTDITSPPGTLPRTSTLYLAASSYDSTTKETTWSFYLDPASGTTRLPLALPSPPGFSPPSQLGLAVLRPSETDSVRIVTLTLSARPGDGGAELIWDNLPPDPTHRQFGAPNSLFDLFAAEPSTAGLARTLPFVIDKGDGVVTGLDVIRALVRMKPDLLYQLDRAESTDLDRSIDVELSGGNDGQRPEAAEYEGRADPNSTTKTGLMALEDIEDISIIAAPGSTYGLEQEYGANAMTIVNLLIAHAQRMRYRIAVLDSGNGQTIAKVRAMRAKLDSTYAALYYPWVKVLDPVTRQEITLPPSGFVAGIYSRNDITRAVYKAPANEVVNLALGFEVLLNKAQQDVLNPEGINCFRFFEGRGYRLWGARTISSDPEWKYVNLRRYFAYLERSIDKGTQWAVFEPNGELLWANVRRTIEDFLLNEWQSGALLGDKPEKAYFVRCDRSTMTQNDLDNGRLVCLIGVAALRPAEFVIFRIGQWTGDRRG